MYVCHACQQPINQASAICPYCGAEQAAGASDDPAKPEKKRSAVQVVLIFAAVVAGLWAIIWFSLPLRYANPQPVAERSAIESLHELGRLLANYAKGIGAYPPALDNLSEPAEAEAREAAEPAMAAGYTLRYAPAQIGADGHAHGYTLVAAPRNYGYRNFYTDQTGVIRATRENRPATAQDPPI